MRLIALVCPFCEVFRRICIFSRCSPCYLFFLGLTEVVSSIFFRDFSWYCFLKSFSTFTILFLDCYSGSRVEISLPKEMPPDGFEPVRSIGDLYLYLFEQNSQEAFSRFSIIQRFSRKTHRRLRSVYLFLLLTDRSLSVLGTHCPPNDFSQTLQFFSASRPSFELFLSKRFRLFSGCLPPNVFSQILQFFLSSVSWLRCCRWWE